MRPLALTLAASFCVPAPTLAADLARVETAPTGVTGVVAPQSLGTDALLAAGITVPAAVLNSVGGLSAAAAPAALTAPAATLAAAVAPEPSAPTPAAASPADESASVETVRPQAAVPQELAVAASAAAAGEKSFSALRRFFDGSYRRAVTDESAIRATRDPGIGAAARLAAGAPSGRRDDFVPEAAQSSPTHASALRARAVAAFSVVAAALPLMALAPSLLAAVGLTPAAWLGAAGFAAGVTGARRAAAAAQDIEGFAPAARALAGPGAMFAGAIVGAAVAALSLWSPAAAAVAATVALLSVAREAGYLRFFDRNRSADEGPEPLLRVSGAEGARRVQISPSQFGRLRLLTAALERGLGEKMLHAGLAAETQRLVYLRRDGDFVELVARGHAMRASTGAPLSRALREAAGDSTIARAQILSENPVTGEVETSLDELFLGDVFGTRAQVESAYAGAYELDEDESSVVRAKAYPRNVELSVRQVYTRNPDQEPGGATRLPDDGRIALSLRVSFDALPQPGYQPRRADPRVGYFTTTYEDWSDDRRARLETSLIQRWRLEKVDPNAAVSRVKNPIIYWIDPSVPPEYRAAVAAGVLGWNRAFEKAGLLGAVEVRQAPNDGSFDSNDARFNVIRWYLDKDAGYAIGQVRVDPLTGEIFGATVAISALHVRAALGATFHDIGGDAEHAAHACAGGCGRASAAAGPAQMTADIVEARGGLSPEDSERFLHDYITDLTLHEVGHTLGLRHNFLAKTWKNEEELSRPGPVAASVMDYLPPNVAAPGQAQGPFWNPQIGPYDEWAIAYGYTDFGPSREAEEAGLRKLADRSGEPGLDYATDEDLVDLDPDMRPWHIGRDALAFARGRFETTRELWAWLETQRPAQGEDHSAIYRKFVRAWRGDLEAARLTADVVAGMSYRRRAGPSGPPFSAIPGARKRAALALLDAQVFSDAPFSAGAELKRRLDAGRGGSVDDPWPELSYVSYDDMILVLRDAALSRLLDPASLQLVEDSARLAPRVEKPLSARELLDAVARSVWKETAGPARGLRRTISISRRMLQEAYLNRMIALAYPRADEETPLITALARGRLEALSARLKTALKLSWDRDSREHLRQSLAKLSRAAERYEP